MTTYPNQKITHINKPRYRENFLQIGTEEWQKAARDLSPAAFKLYLYLAGNADGFDLALSQKAVENTLGISKATYHRAVEQLQEENYLVLKCGNVWDFYTTPQSQKKDSEVSKMRLDGLKNETTQSQKRDLEVSKMSIEIDKTDKINNNIYNKEFVDQKREWMDGLSEEQMAAAIQIGF